MDTTSSFSWPREGQPDACAEEALTLGRAKRRRRAPAPNVSCQPPRNLCAEAILAERCACPQVRTLSQTKYGHKRDGWPGNRKTAPAPYSNLNRYCTQNTFEFTHVLFHTYWASNKHFYLFTVLVSAEFLLQRRQTEVLIPAIPPLE